MKQKINMREATSTALFMLIIATIVLMLASFLYCLLNANEVYETIRTFNYISTGLICIVWPLSVIVSHFRGIKKGRRYEIQRQKR